MRSIHMSVRVALCAMVAVGTAPIKVLHYYYYYYYYYYTFTQTQQQTNIQNMYFCVAQTSCSSHVFYLAEQYNLVVCLRIMLSL